MNLVELMNRTHKVSRNPPWYLVLRNYNFMVYSMDANKSIH